MRRSTTFGVVAALALAGTPAAAADLHFDGVQTERRSGAFAGATLRLDFGGTRTRRTTPVARLGIGMVHQSRDMAGAARGPLLHASAIELGVARGAPELFFAGQSLTDIERRSERLGVGGTTRTALIVAGALAAGVAAVVLLSDDDDEAGICPPGVEVCTQK